MNKREAHNEAMYLISNNIENCKYDIARGCADLAHGIGIITDRQYEKACERIEKERDSFHIM